MGMKQHLHSLYLGNPNPQPGATPSQFVSATPIRSQVNEWLWGGYSYRKLSRGIGFRKAGILSVIFLQLQRDGAHWITHILELCTYTRTESSTTLPRVIAAEPEVIA